MGKDRFELARMASPEEVAEYLTSLAQGLKRGEVALESDGHTLRLVPAADMKLALTAKTKERKGKIELQVGWKRGSSTRANELKVGVGGRLAEAGVASSRRT
jgi:amphi-Trp domain-containing protein